MRILFILPEFPPKIGGMQTHALNIANYFYGLKHEIKVLVYREDERGPHPFKVCGVLSRVSFWKNIRVMKKIIKKFKPDLIYSSTVFYGLLRQKYSIPFICRSVGNDVLRPWISYPYKIGSRLLSIPWLEKKIYLVSRKLKHTDWIESFFLRKRIALMRQSARNCDLIIANSDYTARLLKSIGVTDQQIEVLPGGVNAREFVNPYKAVEEVAALRKTLKLPEKGVLILTVCRLVEKKGLDFLIRAMAEIQKNIPAAFLVVVGDGREKKKLQKLAVSFGLEQKILFCGQKSIQEIPPYFWCADLFVLASRESIDKKTGLKDVETMGRVLCEANAAGIAVLASRTGGVPSVIQHEKNGLLYAIDQQEEFLKNLIRILTDQDLRNNLITNGLERAQSEFDWQVILAKNLSLFQKIIFQDKTKIKTLV